MDEGVEDPEGDLEAVAAVVDLPACNGPSLRKKIEFLTINLFQGLPTDNFLFSNCMAR